MNGTLKKLLRTLQVGFPFLLDTKFKLVRFFRNGLKIPSESEFRALSLFPDVGGALFLDVGANRGQSTDSILLTTRNVRIHLFEPNELLCRKLERLFGGTQGIVINNFGLGDENTEGVLFVPFYRKWMFDGLASFNEEIAKGWLKDRVFFYNERLVTLHRSRTQIRKLDELDLDPYFIKLDIQGYEYRALKGGEQTLRRHEPVLLIESPDDRTVAYLKGLGYQFFAFSQGKFISGIQGETNTFFMTDEKACLVRKHIESGVATARGHA